MLILNGKGIQIIHLLNQDNMTLLDTRCLFVIKEKVKQIRVGHNINPIICHAYLPRTCPEPALCVISHLSEYINRTKVLRKPDCKQLLVSFAKPY